jgi:hypothetical protein
LSVGSALAYVDEAVTELGLRAFNAEKPEERNQAVAASLGVSLGLLNSQARHGKVIVDEPAHHRELAIFPKDEDIRLAAVGRLWGATGGIRSFLSEGVVPAVTPHLAVGRVQRTQADDPAPRRDTHLFGGRVGHLPFLARQVGLLVAGDLDRPVVQYGNAGLVCLAREGDC